jgi:hypothetical protein
MARQIQRRARTGTEDRELWHFSDRTVVAHAAVAHQPGVVSVAVLTRPRRSSVSRERLGIRSVLLVVQVGPTCRSRHQQETRIAFGVTFTVMAGPSVVALCRYGWPGQARP